MAPFNFQGFSRCVERICLHSFQKKKGQRIAKKVRSKEKSVFERIPATKVAAAGDAASSDLLPDFHNQHLSCANESLRSQLTLRERGSGGWVGVA
jgi:hypothetical protein